MAQIALTVRKWTMLTHRWMGVVFCTLFLVWFVSGIVMMYCRFPRVEVEDRLARAPALDPGKVTVSPDQALQAAHAKTALSQVRLNLLDGRPVYRLGFGRRSTLIYADTSEPVGAVPQEMALRIASARFKRASRLENFSTSPDSALFCHP